MGTSSTLPHQPEIDREIWSPAWYYATTLTERSQAFSSMRDKAPEQQELSSSARKRLSRWRSQAPFEHDTYFTQRLEIDGMSEGEFGSLLGETVEEVRNKFSNPPEWLVDFINAYEKFNFTDSSSFYTFSDSQTDVAFLDAIAPVIWYGYDRLYQGIQAIVHSYSTAPFDIDTVRTIFFTNLLPQLSMIINRTMVLELNIARLQGLLEGDTPEDRFQSFAQRIRHPEIKFAILKEYPVLARQIMIRINNWVSSLLEFIQRLCNDYDAIQKVFNEATECGVLVDIEGGIGDRHRGGRSVLIVTFSSGLRVVYKPKSLAVETHFQELLAWINDRNEGPLFRTLTILDCGTYGWVEFVAARECTSSDEVHRFYWRQGGYLALLYALEATDFHYENLIAAGEHPVLVDLESLFQARVGGSDIKQSDLLASNVMEHSVLRVGLLPQPVSLNDGGDRIDLSGLGATSGQLTSMSSWQDAGTDTMRLERQQTALPEGHHRPILDGKAINVLEYSKVINTGFTTIYSLLLRYRTELLAETSPLMRFATDEVRVILRSTQTYAVLLHESFHPDLLRDALNRDRHFDRLWAKIEEHPYLSRVIMSEREDLQRHDIPMFTTRPNSHHIWNSSNEQISNFFEEPGIALVRSRLKRMSDADLAQQCWFIQSSLATLSTDWAQGMSRYETELQSVVNYDALLAAACAVGDRLETLALRGGNDASWLGLTSVKGQQWVLVPLGADLYGGLPGIALFLGYLGSLTQEERYTTLATATLTTLRRYIERGQSSFSSIGGFGGWGGIIYTLTHLSILWDDAALLAEAESIIDLLPPLIEQDAQFDIVDGAAGCIGSLISLYQCKPSQRTLAVAVQCGEHLLAHAAHMDQGVAWITDIAPRPLGGFAHGASGVAWALLKLAALTNDERFRVTALAAFEYERSLFVPEQGNWRDLRELETLRLATRVEEDIFITAWCHGAPGIGLARVSVLQQVDDAVVRAELNTALQTTLLDGFGLNDSLCHGDLGNLELFIQAEQMLGDARWRSQIDRISATILQRIAQEGWQCGVGLSVETPGLMTGLAGIGYGLLRLANPTCVPAVLVLEAPAHKQPT